MNFRHLFIPKRQEAIWTLDISLSLKDERLYELYTSVYSEKTRGYMNFRHLFIPKRQEAIWTLDICLSLKNKSLYERYTSVYP